MTAKNKNNTISMGNMMICEKYNNYAHLNLTNIQNLSENFKTILS